jgi:BolA protein
MSLAEIITEKLLKNLKNPRIEVINESHLHKGHRGDNGTGESHFALSVQSSSFEGLGRVERQKLIYQILADEMKDKIHALRIIKADLP